MTQRMDRTIASVALTQLSGVWPWAATDTGAHFRSLQTFCRSCPRLETFFASVSAARSAKTTRLSRRLAPYESPLVHGGAGRNVFTNALPNIPNGCYSYSLIPDGITSEVCR